MLKTYNESQFRVAINGKRLCFGKFTSPHLVDRWDGIQFDGKAIDRREFDNVEARVLERNHREHVQASEFEILTATAFEAFNSRGVDVGIVEVGMGGEQDATNILGSDSGLELGDQDVLRCYRPLPLVTAITKIGLDHQTFLGQTLAAITTQKAGIIKHSVPVVVDESNDMEVQKVITSHASHLDAPLVSMHNLTLHLAEEMDQTPNDLLPNLGSTSSMSNNVSVAFRAACIALSQLIGLQLTDIVHSPRLLQHYKQLLYDWSNIAGSARAPGRLEWTSIDVKGKKIKMLVDGAHNAQSAAFLVEFLEHCSVPRPITWIYGASQGRAVKESLDLLLRPGDSIFAVEFGPVDGMPWVHPTPADDILSAARLSMGEGSGSLVSCGSDVAKALSLASGNVGETGMLVVTGSLYLVGDVHRVIRGVQSRSC